MMPNSPPSCARIIFIASFLAAIALGLSVITLWFKRNNDSLIQRSNNRIGSSLLDDGNNSSLLCHVSLNDIFYESYDGLDERPKDEFYTCIPVNRTTGLLSPLEYVLPTGPVEDLLDEHSSVLQNGDGVYVSVPRGLLIKEREYSVLVPEASVKAMRVVSPSEIEWLQSQQQAHDNHSGYYKHRKLRQPPRTGKVTILIIRVSTSDSSPHYTAEELYRLHFEDKISLAKQFNRCSMGKLEITPTKYKVLDVKLDNEKAHGNSYNNLVNAANVAAIKLVDEAVDNIRNLAHMTVFVIPPGTGDWAAFATMRGKQSVFNNLWAGSVGAMMHELGHNLGLYHANLPNGNEYKDRSGYMGMADQVEGYPEKCYNAQNSWYLGWYKDRAIEALPERFANKPIHIELRPIVDYEITPIGQYVLVKVGDLYLQYNRKKGINMDTSGMIDALTIVKEVQRGTEMMGGLNEKNKVYQMYDEKTQQTMTIECCFLDKQNDIVTVGIGYGNNVCSGFPAI